MRQNHLPPKTFVRIIVSALFLGYLILIFATFEDYGITNDEPAQNEYGKRVLKYYTSFFSDLSFLSYSNLYLYGGLFDSLAALSNHFSFWPEYETRHLLNALVGFLGVLGVYHLTKYLTHSAVFGLLGALFIFLSPRYYGHSFNNPKDIPFAVFYLLSILSIVRSMAYWERGKSSLASLAGLGISIGCCMGTRVGGLVLICYLVLFHSLYCLGSNESGPSRVKS